MNIDLRIKWLLYILNKNNNQGFSFWELIIVLFAMGIFAAIVLPLFQNQSNRAYSSEAKQYVSSINKAQQAYYTDNGKFVTENTPAGWASLGVGIRTQTTNYKYLISPIGDGKNGVNALAIPLTSRFKGYTGVVGLVGTNPRDKISQAIGCETKNAGDTPASGEVTATEVKCPSNSDPLR